MLALYVDNLSLCENRADFCQKPGGSIPYVLRQYVQYVAHRKSIHQATKSPTNQTHQKYAHTQTYNKYHI
jgi:hypothetical protein